MSGYKPQHWNPAPDSLTLRDYFAAMALQGILSGPDFKVHREKNGALCKTSDEVREELSRRAYAYADAMLAERDK